jgi:hypothetical protein
MFAPQVAPPALNETITGHQHIELKEIINVDYDANRAE